MTSTSSQSPCLLFAVSCMAMSLMMAWAYNRSSGSVLTALPFHKSWNTMSVVCPSVPGRMGIDLSAGWSTAGLARNIFILRCGTKNYVLFVPQSLQRINSGRSPCRLIASENRGTYKDDAGQHQGSRIIGLGPEKKRFDKPGRD